MNWWASNWFKANWYASNWFAGAGVVPPTPPAPVASSTGLLESVGSKGGYLVPTEQVLITYSQAGEGYGGGPDWDISARAMDEYFRRRRRRRRDEEQLVLGTK